MPTRSCTHGQAYYFGTVTYCHCPPSLGLNTLCGTPWGSYNFGRRKEVVLFLFGSFEVFVWYQLGLFLWILRKKNKGFFNEFSFFFGKKHTRVLVINSRFVLIFPTINVLRVRILCTLKIGFLLHLQNCACRNSQPLVEGDRLFLFTNSCLLIGKFYSSVITYMIEGPALLMGGDLMSALLALLAHFIVLYLIPVQFLSEPKGKITYLMLTRIAI